MSKSASLMDGEFIANYIKRDANQFARLQEILSDLDKDSVNSAISYIRSSVYGTDNSYIPQFLDCIYRVSKIKIFKLDQYISLLISLSNSCTSENCLDLIRPALTKYLMKSSTKDVDRHKALLLLMLYKSEYIQFSPILQEIMNGAEPHVFIAFANEIKNESEELYFNYLKNLSACVAREHNSTLNDIYNNIDNPSNIINLLKVGVYKGPLVPIMNDQILEFQEYVENNPDIYEEEKVHRDYLFFSNPPRSTIDFVCLYGAEKVFNYINMTNSNAIKNRLDYLLDYACYGGSLSIIRKVYSMLKNKQNPNIARSLVPALKGLNFSVAQWLIESCESNSENVKEILSPLMIPSASSNDARIVKFCLSAGCSLEQRELDGSNIMHAIAKSNSTLVLSVIDKYSPQLFDAVDEKGNTPLHYAAYSGSISVVQYLLSFPLLEVNTENKEKLTPIQVAATLGQWEIVSILFENNQVNRNVKSPQGNNLLALAIVSQNPETIQYVMGTEYYDMLEKNSVGKSALEIAAETANPKIYEIIFSKFDMNAEYTDENTALHYCVKKDSLFGIRYLKDHKAFPNPRNISNETPLHLAVRMNKVDIVKELLTMEGINVNVQSIDGKTPLALAVFLEHAECVQVLLEAGADPNIRQNTNESLLYMSGNHEIIGMLKCHGLKE